MTRAPTHRQLVDEADRAATIEAHFVWQARRDRRRAAVHHAAAAVRHTATVAARAVTVLTPLVWLAAAGLAGAMLESAAGARATGDDTLAWALAVPAALLAATAVKVALTETMSARAAQRHAARMADLLEDAETDCAVLLRRNRALWARAKHWKEIAQREAREADVAMRHTPLGETLVEIRSLHDTRERST